MLAYIKAIIAALVAGLGSLATALTDDPSTAVDESAVSGPEIIAAIVAFLMGLGLVTAVRNAGFVNLNKIHEYELQGELAVAARDAYVEQPKSSTGTTDWARVAGAVVSTLRR